MAPQSGVEHDELFLVTAAVEPSLREEVHAFGLLSYRQDALSVSLRLVMLALDCSGCS